MQRPWLKYLRWSIEGALALFLAVQAGRLVWVFAEPPTANALAAPTNVKAAESNVLERFNPFADTTSTQSESDPEPITPLFLLYGVRPGASAIIGAPGMGQKAVRIGETIAPGVILKAVRIDHVILVVNGSEQRLALSKTAPAASSPGAYTSPPR